MAEPRADAPFAARSSSSSSTALSVSDTLLHASTHGTPTRPACDNQRATASSSDDVHVKDDDAALVVLKYSMAQNELREMVQALYTALDAHEQRADASKKEAALLREKHERWKHETQLERELARKQAQQYQHDIIWANQQMQQAQMQTAELEAENRRLATQSEEKDKIIEQLNQQLTDFISKHQNAQVVGGSLGGELERVAADFSRKEREVYNNMDHVRKATTSLQHQGKDMSSQINYRECTETKYVPGFIISHLLIYCDSLLYAECRAFVEKGDSSSLMETRPPDSAACHDIHGVQQVNADLQVENLALAERCKHLSDELSDAKARVAELTEQNESLKKLVSRFEESAEDGTQTIEFLQESLVKLCDQITSERQQHESTLAKAIDTAQEKEHQLTQDLQQFQLKLHESENKNEAEAVSAILERLETERQTQKFSNQKRKKDSRKPTKPHKMPKSTPRSAISSRSIERTTASSFQETAPCVIKSTEIVDEIEDADDDILSAAEARSSSASSKIVIQPATTICRSCGAKPFGFMVKCQKCKDPFHARCVKPPDGKRRVSHVFKCSACTLQRPTKVIRLENSTSVAADVASKWSRRPTAIFSPLPPPVSRPQATGVVAEALPADTVTTSTLETDSQATTTS